MARISGYSLTFTKNPLVALQVICIRLSTLTPADTGVAPLPWPGTHVHARPVPGCSGLAQDQPGHAALCAPCGSVTFLRVSVSVSLHLHPILHHQTQPRAVLGQRSPTSHQLAQTRPLQPPGQGRSLGCDGVLAHLLTSFVHPPSICGASVVSRQYPEPLGAVCEQKG